MASISNLLKIHTQSIKSTNPKVLFQVTKSHFSSLTFPSKKHHYNLSFFPKKHQKIAKIPLLSLHCTVSSSSPPISKEEAILQAKTCLSTTLQKPLNNPKLAGKLKKQKQPRFRIEIPVIDDKSPSALSKLAFDIFGEMPVRRKGSVFNLVIIWPNLELSDIALKAFIESNSLKNHVAHIDIDSVNSTDNNRTLNSADVVVFFVPEVSKLAVVKTVAERLNPKPVVIFNPTWVFEDEEKFDGGMSNFVGSFDVIYSFMGLEVRGILSKRKGMVFRHVKDGISSGEKWNVFVEEDGEMKVISRFKERPPIGEVENVLYNLMAINSPITKSVKFIKDLASNVTGKK